MDVDDDKFYVVCIKVSEMNENLTVDGAEKDTCSMCRSEVWLSPATKQTKIQNNGEVVCMSCAVLNGAKEFMIGPDQIKEAKEQFRREAQRN